VLHSARTGKEGEIQVLTQGLGQTLVVHFRFSGVLPGLEKPEEGRLVCRVVSHQHLIDGTQEPLPAAPLRAARTEQVSAGWKSGILVKLTYVFQATCTVQSCH